MPLSPDKYRKAEDALKHHAQILFPKNPDKQDQYVFGRLRDMGWKPGDAAKGKK